MKLAKTTMLPFIAGLALLTACTDDRTPKQVSADNTARNERDARGDTLTAGDQSENEADRTLTQRIRQAIVANDALSTNAQNVKIITVDGVVTLRGPVNTDQEKAQVSGTAEQIAGAGRVRNELEVVRN